MSDLCELLKMAQMAGGNDSGICELDRGGASAYVSASVCIWPEKIKYSQRLLKDFSRNDVLIPKDCSS